VRRGFSMRGWWSILAALVVAGGAGPALADEELRAAVKAAMRQAGGFFRGEVAAGGGYLWLYSEDLRRREGEGEAGAATVWVQPPGTPTVGMAYLDAHEASGDAFFLEAAREAAGCLMEGQLVSGSWTYRIELDPAARGRYAYRAGAAAPGERASSGRRNVSTLDDDTTQAALRFLMRLDRRLGFEDERLHEAVLYGLEALLAAQFPCGAFPQGFDGPVEKLPVKKASQPQSWSRTHPAGQPYWRYYTLNDGVIEDAIDVLLEAARVYGEKRYREAALEAGDFLLLAQMPEPQPGWAQQYDFEMHPAWARRFEPPALSGGEGQGVLAALLKLHRETGEARFLEPLPRALAYYRRSLLPDGRLARFYELGSNRPLYFTRRYELTYDDGDLPTHYAFKVASRLERLEREYERAKALRREDLERGAAEEQSPRLTPELAAETRKVIAALDERGRWLEEGSMKSAPEVRRVIASRTFVRNLAVLSRYLRAAR
jgi:hypothetical protein